MAEETSTLVVVRVTDKQLKDLGLDKEQQQLFDSLKLAMEVKSRMRKDEILRDRIISMSLHFMSSGSGQVGLPKEEVRKYKNRVTEARVYPLYSDDEMIALVVSGEIKAVSPQKPIFVIVPKETPGDE